ncbi:MAG: hypothetical protein EOM66_03845 [Clostridia bacterium]|nr:hypothetical protein [Clostridia bacterium]
MARKMIARGLTVQKITREGLTEKNLADGTEQVSGSRAGAAENGGPADGATSAGPVPGSASSSGSTRYHHRAEKYEKQLSRAQDRLSDARAEIPMRERTRTDIDFDAQAGKVIRTKVHFTEDKPKPHVTKITEKQRRHKAQARKKVYQAVREQMDDTTASDALHKGVKVADYTVSEGRKLAHNAVARHRTAPYDRVEKLKAKANSLERKTGRVRVKADYKDFVRANPQLTSTPYSRWQVKRKIRRKYATMIRAGKSTFMAKIGNFFASAKDAVLRKMKGWAVAAGGVCMVIFMISNTGSCSNLFAGPGAAVIGSSYTAEDEDIAAATAQYTKLEAELQKEIDTIESTHPGYDEYRFEVDEIGHDPQELMAYLTAKYQAFTYSQVSGEIQTLFDKQYKLSLEPTTETYTTSWTDADGNTHTETHVKHILNVRLSNTRLSSFVADRLDKEQLDLYTLYLETKGNKEYFISPFGTSWQPMQLYGYAYKDGEVQEYDGMDVYCTSSSLVAPLDGVVTSASGDSVTITDKFGYSVTYGNIGGASVSVGQEVKKGDAVGSASGYLHLELSYKGKQLNPYFYFQGCDNSALGGANLMDVQGNPYTVPTEALSDPAFASLLTEAEKYLGYKYVWGGSNPGESFDCSGFVCWSLNQSGTASVGRTNAQGLYNRTAVVDPSQAQAGDLIYFTGSRSKVGHMVTHVGIYVGDGVMLHSDSGGVRYSKITTPYWTKNFYAFGRL